MAHVKQVEVVKKPDIDTEVMLLLEAAKKAVAIQQNKNYHNEKTESCKNNGITLLHIFHDEWRDKRQIVESMIINKLHLSKKIGARKCSISKISLSDSKDLRYPSDHLPVFIMLKFKKDYGE